MRGNRLRMVVSQSPRHRLRHQFRVRETHVRDHVVPLISSNATGAAKLDLVLRGLAFKQAPSDGLPIGSIDPSITWGELHDLVRPGAFYDADRGLKRKWVSEQLARLERLQLLERREPVVSRRPLIVVLSDRGDGRVLDDPDGQATDSYVTVLGKVANSGHLAHWSGAEVAAYIAAMIAERYARADPVLNDAWSLDYLKVGAGKWYRNLSWFADPEHLRPPSHIRVPMSEHTLRAGLRSLRARGAIATRYVRLDPRTGAPFKGVSRVVYTNRFDKLSSHDLALSVT